MLYKEEFLTHLYMTNTLWVSLPMLPIKIITSHYHNEIKVKVKLSSLYLFLTEHHAMKAYCGNGGIAPCILDVQH